MAVLEQSAGVDPQAKAALQRALENLAKGIAFTAEEKAEACRRMDRLREENRRLFGEQNSAVALIRETRDTA